MRTWRLILAIACGLLMTAALVIFVNPESLTQAKTLIEYWYWKAGGWIDYAPAPEGVPDFDQKQASTGGSHPFYTQGSGPTVVQLRWPTPYGGSIRNSNHPQ